MKRWAIILRIFATLWSLLISHQNHEARAADTFYVSPTGADTDTGSSDSPWASFEFAIAQLDAGDTLYVHGGEYSLTERIRIRAGGTSVQPINIWAMPGEVPILDFSEMNAAWGSSNGRGLQIDAGADWLHVRGLTIQNARDNGIWSGARHGVFEQTVTRWNGDSGLQLSGAASHNLVLNADSYENYDPSNNGENADGFALKFENLGPGNVVRGARAWGNADDGWDMWESRAGGVLVEDSWAFENGKLISRFFDVDALENDDLTARNFQGDGNGFKLGHDGGAHVLNRVVVWENRERGIDVNGNGFGVQVSNSTVFNSGRNWLFDETARETINLHELRNNISFAGSDGDTFQSSVADSNNTWNRIRVSEDDFLSLDDTIARGPRRPDGSLPVSDFLRLAPDSNLIDAGVDVGLAFLGSAPDVGAYEFMPERLSADFNADGFVDGADFTVWRDGLGDTYVESDYGLWVEQFGQAAIAESQSVPEPAGSPLLSLGVMAMLCLRHRSA